MGEEIVKVALGTFTCSGIEAKLGSDVTVCVQAAIGDYVRRLKAGAPPIGIPGFLRGSTEPRPSSTYELQVDADTRFVLEREAARQQATLSQLIAHSVQLYLAEFDRLTPLNAA